MATNFNPKEKSKGLGDSVARVTNFLKLDKVADAVAKLVDAEGCGCEERRQYLNELFPYGKKRKFKVLRDFSMEGLDFHKNNIFEVSNKDVMHSHTINLVQSRFIEEI